MNGSVYKRCNCSGQQKCRKKHGSWTFIHDLPAPSGSGERPRSTRGGFRTKREAEDALRESLAQASHHGRTTTPGNRPELVKDYLRRWLDNRQQLKATTRLSYQQHIDRHLIPRLGHLPLRDLNVTDIEEAYQSLRRPKARQTGRGRLSPATIQRIHATLRKALNDAVRRQLLDRNPANLVELESTPYLRATYWTSAEAGKFLDAIVDDRLYALYQLTIHRGLRRGEVVALQWKDVDLARRTLDVNHTLVQLGYETIDETPKSTSSNRVLSLDRETILTLERHHARQREEFRTLGREVGADDYVFTREDGRRYHPENVSRYLARLIGRAQVRPLTFHQLRHTAASLMLEAGADIKYVQHVLGHEDMFITARIYAHVTTRLDRERSGQVANLIPRRRRTTQPDADPDTEPGDTDTGGGGLAEPA